MGTKFDKEIDSWALGVILYRLLTKSYPFYDSNQLQLLDKIRKAEPDFEDEKWESISFEALDVVENLLQKDTKLRIKLDKILI